MGVSFVHVILWGIYLTRNLICLVSTMFRAQTCLQRRWPTSTCGRVRPDDIVDLKKLAEGGFNRSFLITMRDGFQIVARIPYPATTPKYFAVASEVTTMALLRSSGPPVPEVYGYSPVPDNAAETEYIFMEFVQGTSLSDIWFDLGEGDIISITRQLAELESKMMSIAFPAGGSLYFTKDLEKVAGRPGIPLEDKRFCVGPDTRLPCGMAGDHSLT